MNIRPFNRSRQDAQGIIKVDQETFGDCHYAPEYIIHLLADAQQQAWVAEQTGQIVGFVSAFATQSLARNRLEIDELAVRPCAQGQGVGTALIARALSQGRTGSTAARALIAITNIASQRAFVKNDFAPAGQVTLMLHEISETKAPLTADTQSQVRGVLVRGVRVRLAHVGDAAAIERLSGAPAQRAARLLQHTANRYLVAEHGSSILGYVELLPVCTLQYRGFWIESAAAAQESVASALLPEIAAHAKALGTIDRIGYLADDTQPICRASLRQNGYHEIGSYQVFTRPLNDQDRVK